ncbi:peptidoglycan-binding domain-containing protein [Scytonema sp. PCC 10023]|uniref:peptidoglycan-binding domain-containing protein n=1 Tax=Scytonema sp. PCC 10023 TaxID=1680591 RepID=UPI0039C61320
MTSIDPSAAQTTATKNLPILKRGSKGRAVAYLQFLLISYGINVSGAGVDGDFGANTENAVKQFQQQYNSVPNVERPKLTVDGQVGEKTWRALGDNFYRTCGPTEWDDAVKFPNITGNDLPTLKKDDKGEAVRLLQQMLLALNYISNDSFDGNFSQDIDTAVRNFQAAANIRTDGEVGANTWGKLFEVSRVACDRTVSLG